MKQQLNELKRMQQLAGILKENYNESIAEDGQGSVPSELANDPNFKKLVASLKANPEAAEELGQELKESLEEDSKYMDYIDATPKEISSKEYWARKLKAIGLTAAAGALLGIGMAGGTSASDILQMALGAATAGGTIGATLMTTVGKAKK